MNLKIKLSKKNLYLLFFLVGLLATIILINALVPGTKPNPGHLAPSDVSVPTNCVEGQVIKWSDSNNNNVGEWICEDADSGYKVISLSYLHSIGKEGNVVADTSLNWDDLGIDVSSLKSEGYEYVTANVARIGDTSGNGASYRYAYVDSLGPQGVDIKSYSTNDASGYIWRGIELQFIFSKSPVETIYCNEAGCTSQTYSI